MSELAINDLKDIFSKVCKDFGSQLIECNGEDDHVHLLVNYPPKVSISSLINSLCLADCFESGVPKYADDTGKVFFGRHPTSRHHAAVHRSLIKQYVEQQRETAPPPRPKGRGFRRGSFR